MHPYTITNLITNFFKMNVLSVKTYAILKMKTFKNVSTLIILIKTK